MLHPAHDYVVIEVSHQTESGILLSRHNNQAQVIAIGPDVKNPVYHIGSQVYFDETKGIACGEYILIQDAYILAEIRV